MVNSGEWSTNRKACFPLIHQLDWWVLLLVNAKLTVSFWSGLVLKLTSCCPVEYNRKKTSPVWKGKVSHQKQRQRGQWLIQGSHKELQAENIIYVFYPAVFEMKNMCLREKREQCNFFNSFFFMGASLWSCWQRFCLKLLTKCLFGCFPNQIVNSAIETH